MYSIGIYLIHLNKVRLLKVLKIIRVLLNKTWHARPLRRPMDCWIVQWLFPVKPSAVKGEQCQKIIIYISVVTVIYYSLFFEATSCKVVYLHLIILDKYLIILFHQVNTGTTAILIKVQDVEDQPPEFIAMTPVARISENVRIGTSVLQGQRYISQIRQNYFQFAESNFKHNLTW